MGRKAKQEKVIVEPAIPVRSLTISQLLVLRDRLMQHEDSQYGFSDFESLADSHAIIHVARVTQGVIGFLVELLRGEDITLLESVYVAPSWRNCGVASALMRALTKEKSFLYVGTINTSAINLYLRRGYRQVSTSPRYMGTARYASVVLSNRYGSMCDAHLMANYSVDDFGFGTETFY